MRTTTFLPSLFLLVAACGHDDDDHDPDAEACEHLEKGPYTNVTASAAHDDTAPRVAADHMAYTVPLTVSAVGYVAFPAAKATDYVVFLDRPVPFQVLDAAGAMVTLEASETSSPACAAIRGKHTFPLPVGTAYFGLGPAMGDTPVNLVVEEAGDHDEH
jgi:hypothetical protein